MANAAVTRHRKVNVNFLEYAMKHREEVLCDAIIATEHERIPAHRLVLSCYSPYFERYFKIMARTQQYVRVIEIEDVDGETMKSIIDFIYSGSITINNQNVMNLLSGAENFKMNEIKEFCFEFLESNLGPENCLNAFKAAIVYKNKPLEKALDFIWLHFDQVLSAGDYNTLSKQDLIVLITELNKTMLKSNMIYQAIVSWSRHDDDRKDEFLDLFKLLDLNDISTELLENVIMNEDLVKTSSDCQKLIILALMQKLKKFHETKIVCTSRFLRNKKLIVVYDLENYSDAHFPDIPGVGVYPDFSLLLLKNHIYFICGNVKRSSCLKVRITNHVWRLDTRKRHSAWEPVAAMNADRCWGKVVVHNDSVVAVGGHDGRDYLSSCEYYQSSFFTWKNMATLPQNRYAHALVSSKGCLYVLGGICVKKQQILSSVIQLKDLTATSWKTFKQMQTPRAGLASANCRGELYAIGGKSGEDQSTTLKTVEKYDEVAKQWKYVSDMNIERRFHGVCVLQDMIYVVGGRNKNDVVVTKIDRYNPASDIWKIVEKVPDCKGLHLSSLIAL